MLKGWIIVVVLVVLVILLSIRTYNQLVGKKEMVQNAKGQIAAQLESRWDALSNLIDATKKYSMHEKEVLENITKARSHTTATSSVKELERDDRQFQRAIEQIQVVMENYPELKASQVYETTMHSVNEYENNVRHSRMIYNDTVTKYNRDVKAFPAVLFAGMFGFHPEEYFQNTDAKEDMPSW